MAKNLKIKCIFKSKAHWLAFICLNPLKGRSNITPPLLYAGLVKHFFLAREKVKAKSTALAYRTLVLNILTAGALH